MNYMPRVFNTMEEAMIEANKRYRLISFDENTKCGEKITSTIKFVEGGVELKTGHYDFKIYR